MRMLCAYVLENRQVLEIAAHAVQNDQVQALLISDNPRLRKSALVERNCACAIVGLQVPADVLKVRRVG
jgi:hypothetical protein